MAKYSDKYYKKVSCIDCGKKHRTQIVLGQSRNLRCYSCAAKIRNLGRCVSPEVRAKISASLMGHKSFAKKGRKLRPEEVERIRIMNTGNTYRRGKTVSQESKERMSKAQKKAWESVERRKVQSERRQGNNHNLDLKKSAEARENMRIAHIGKKLSDKAVRALRIGHNTTAYKMKVSEQVRALHSRPDSPFKTAQCREKHRKAFKDMWRNPTSKVNSVEYRNKLADRLMDNIRNKSTYHYNDLERELDELIQQVVPNQYKYNGGGELGFKIYYHTPDFVNVNGQKKIIEINGCAWHCCSVCGNAHPTRQKADDVRNRDKRNIEYAEQLGYKVLTIWEHELGDRQAVINRIIEFNGSDYMLTKL